MYYLLFKEKQILSIKYTYLSISLLVECKWIQKLHLCLFNAVVLF